MALYRPLGPAQLVRLHAHLDEIAELHELLSHFVTTYLNHPHTDDDVNELSIRIGQFRAALSRLDLVAFSTWDLIHRLRDEVHPVRSQPTRAKSSSDLAALLEETRKESNHDHPAPIVPPRG
jgi:hypothetical protein